MLRRVSRQLTRLIPIGTPIPILRGPLFGHIWFAGAAAGEGKGLSPCLNLCEPEQLRVAEEHAKRAKICFDIGANVGLYSLLFAKHCDLAFAFEPLPRNIQWLKRSLKSNHIENVTVVETAVSDYCGRARFQQGENCAIGAIHSGGQIEVNVITIDDAVRTLSAVPDLIKIDVEGGELSVLKGAQNTLRTKPSILLSTHGDDLKNDCFAHLRGLGYTAFRQLSEAEFSIN